MISKTMTILQVNSAGEACLRCFYILYVHLSEKHVLFMFNRNVPVFSVFIEK